MNNDKFFWHVFGSLLIIFYASFLLLSSMYQFGAFNTLVTAFFVIYGVIHLALALANYNTKEFSHFFLGVIGIISFSILYCSNILTSIRGCSFFFFLFALLTCFIKLKKADYFHDRKNILWRMELSFLFLYFLATILFCVNLVQKDSVLTLLFGFYILFIGSLEFMEAMVFNLKGKLK